MEIKRNSGVLLLFVFGSLYIVDSVDPHYMSKAKILTRQEVEASSSRDQFSPSARKCVKVGERAAKKHLSCIADTEFFETFANRVHMSRTVGRHADRDLKLLAYRISKCSLYHSKYFERSCKSKAKYLNERRRCRRLRTVREKSLCRMSLRRNYGHMQS